MVVVCSLCERKEILRSGKNKDEETKEEGDLKNVKEQEKEMEKDTEVEEETAVEKLYRTIVQDEKEEEKMFRIIQEKKEELRRSLKEQKAKLFRLRKRLELCTSRMSQVRAATVNPAAQRQKNTKRRRRNISAMSTNNVRFGTSDPKKKKGLQGFPDTSGTVDFTGPDIKGLFLIMLLVSLMSFSSGQNHERPTDCRVDQEPITQEWKLFCQFPVDIREQRQDFQVFQLNSDGSPDLVVDGTWIEDELKAFTADGYVPDGPVSDQLVIRMQRPVVYPGQIYTCTLPYTPLEQIKTCQVPKKEASVTARLNTLAAVHNEAWRSVNYEKMLITAAITCGMICGHV